jgi:hypothetical protein
MAITRFKLRFTKLSSLRVNMSMGGWIENEVSEKKTPKEEAFHFTKGASTIGLTGSTINRLIITGEANDIRRTAEHMGVSHSAIEYTTAQLVWEKSSLEKIPTPSVTSTTGNKVLFWTGIALLTYGGYRLISIVYLMLIWRFFIPAALLLPLPLIGSSILVFRKYRKGKR